MITLGQVSKTYHGGKTIAVHELDLEIAEGEFLALLGESGSGKTTTLKMINRLIEPSSGRILVDGQSVLEQDPAELRRGIGYVFQGIGLFPHITIAQNVGVVPNLLGWSREEIDSRVSELLDLVGLPAAEYADRMPSTLSGGQQQRVGVARALAARPRIMLMDEPFGALDPVTRQNLQDEYLRIHKSLGLTSVMVTHDMTEALLMSDRVAVLREGRILALGTPHDLLTEPGDPYVQALIQMPKQQADRLEALVEGSPS
jgi:osmoprotectant transport system ATP-binding protein